MKDTPAQKYEASMLLHLSEQAQILSARINRIRFYQKSNGRKHIPLISRTHDRAVRREKAFWRYVQDNLTTLGRL